MFLPRPMGTALSLCHVPIAHPSSPRAPASLPFPSWEAVTTIPPCTSLLLPSPCISLPFVGLPRRLRGRCGAFAKYPYPVGAPLSTILCFVAAGRDCASLRPLLPGLPSTHHHAPTHRGPGGYALRTAVRTSNFCCFFFFFGNPWASSLSAFSSGCALLHCEKNVRISFAFLAFGFGWPHAPLGDMHERMDKSEAANPAGAQDDGEDTTTAGRNREAR